jgi:peptide/nickel transport system permease protein
MSYYAKRIVQTVVVFLSTVTVTFMMYRLMPFGPVEQMKSQLQSEYQKSGQSLSRAQIEQINQQVETLTNIQPDAPLLQQYLSYMEGVLLHADFGTSIVLQEPVFEVLFGAMPWSVFISVYGLALGTTISLLLGAIMAYKEGSSFDTGLTVVSTLTQTVPYYIVAILVLIVFAFQLEWLPTGGKMTPGTEPGLNWPFIAGVVEHAALPVLSSFIAGFGGALAYRGNCVREMGKGYLRLARLRGLSQGRIAIRYVGRNALLPIYTTLMLGGCIGVWQQHHSRTDLQLPCDGLCDLQCAAGSGLPTPHGRVHFFQRDYAARHPCRRSDLRHHRPTGRRGS